MHPHCQWLYNQLHNSGQLQRMLVGFQGFTFALTLETIVLSVPIVGRGWKSPIVSELNPFLCITRSTRENAPEMADNGEPHYITAMELAVPSSAHEVRPKG